MERSEGDQVTDGRDPLLIPAPEADRPELRERTDRLARAGPDRFDAGDQGGPDGAEADTQHGQPPVGGRDLGGARGGTRGLLLA